MKERLLAYIKENNLYSPGDIVCCGLSGGPDSVCLILLLDEIKDQLGISIRAFHVNHNLRGECSDGDEAFVRELCAKKGIPLKVFSYDVAGYAKDRGLGTEDAGRILRREAARECISEGSTKIAFAHHRNDLAETVIFNISRGSSIRGLAGIRPSQGIFTHPILFAGRNEIEEWLTARAQAWRTDATNNDNEYTRNLIRNKVIPVLENEVNDAAVRHISEAAADLALADELIGELAYECFETYVHIEADRLILDKKVSEYNRLVAGRTVQMALSGICGSKKDITRQNINDVLELFGKQSGSVLDLPYRMRARNIYGSIEISVSGAKDKDSDVYSGESVKLEKNMDIVFGGWHIIVQEDEIPLKISQIPKKEYTKWLDYDIIKNTVLRFRKDGDYMVINAQGNRKKLGDIFTDKKIPKRERDEILLIAEGSRVFWAVGARLSEDAKITGETRKTVRIDIKRR